MGNNEAYTQRLKDDFIKALIDYNIKMDAIIKEFVGLTNELNAEFNERIHNVQVDKTAEQ